MPWKVTLINKLIDCNLSKKQLKTTNGCGSSYWLASIFRIPKWFGWDMVCNIHDYKWSKSTKLIDKHIADDELYNAMMYDAFNNSTWFTKGIKIQTAIFVNYCLSTKLSDRCFKNAIK